MDSIWPQQDLDGNSCMFRRYLSEDNIFDNSEIETDISTTLFYIRVSSIPYEYTTKYGMGAKTT